jgi:hypothetical protein
MSTTTTIEQFMALPANQQYREIRFYNSGLTGLDELNVSRFGAIHLHNGVKTFFPSGETIIFDDANRTVVLGSATTYLNLEFKYHNLFYV